MARTDFRVPAYRQRARSDSAGGSRTCQVPGKASSYTPTSLFIRPSRLLRPMRVRMSCFGWHWVRQTGLSAYQFFALVEESGGWQEVAIGPQWWESGTEFLPQRDGETGRLPGVRALLLYPMNALVEDQLGRLRRALDSDGSRDWLDSNRNGHRFYFGRYTGNSPVSGHPSNQNKRRELRSVLADSSRRFARWRGDDEKRYFVPSPDGAEMRSRWDMQAHAPDLLITNYSMLNIMLLRQLEAPIFDQTRAWIEDDPSHVFHVVVDELPCTGEFGTELLFISSWATSSARPPPRS